MQYRAVVLDNAGHTRSSAVATATIAPPAIALEAPNEGQRVRGTVEVRAIATPEHADYVVTFERSVNGGPFTTVGTDDSSPVYTVVRRHVEPARRGARDLPRGAHLRAGQDRHERARAP